MKGIDFSLNRSSESFNEKAKGRKVHLYLQFVDPLRAVIVAGRIAGRRRRAKGGSGDGDGGLVVVGRAGVNGGGGVSAVDVGDGVGVRAEGGVLAEDLDANEFVHGAPMMSESESKASLSMAVGAEEEDLEDGDEGAAEVEGDGASDVGEQRPEGVGQPRRLSRHRQILHVQRCHHHVLPQPSSHYITLPEPDRTLRDPHVPFLSIPRKHCSKGPRTSSHRPHVIRAQFMKQMSFLGGISDGERLLVVAEAKKLKRRSHVMADGDVISAVGTWESSVFSQSSFQSTRQDVKYSTS